MEHLCQCNVRSREREREREHACAVANVHVRAGVVQEKVLNLVRRIDWIERTIYLCKVRSTRAR